MRKVLRFVGALYTKSDNEVLAVFPTVPMSIWLYIFLESAIGTILLSLYLTLVGACLLYIFSFLFFRYVIPTAVGIWEHTVEVWKTC